MHYIKINGYNYTDHPNDETLYFGQRTGSQFVHQLIEDREIEVNCNLDEAVLATSEATADFAGENGFSMSFGEIEHIMIDQVDFALRRQEMFFDDGRWAVQSNAYFFDPQDHVFRMTQFGTLPISSDDHDQYGEGLTDYVTKCMKRIIANMSMPKGSFALKIPGFEVS